MDSLLNSLTAALFTLLSVFSTTEEDPTYSGYVEGDYRYIAARDGGYIDELAVRDGDNAKAGVLLFSLDRDRQREAVAAAKADLAASRANLADLRKGARQEELDVIDARRRQAVANLNLARLTYKRTDKLVSRRALPESRRDEDQAALNEARATLRQYQAELATARLPARQDRLEQARHNIDAARARLKQAEADLADRTVLAPADARVDRVFLYPGEYAKAGTPVLALLPPGEVKIRFFLPEPVFTQIRIGDQVEVSCSSCPAPRLARVTYLASEAEHTPPVIFSREERSKLVFMVEATPENPGDWHPGQPVDVRLAP